MTRTILIVAGLTALAFLAAYWRLAIFLSMSLFVAGLHNPLLLASIAVAALAGAVFWARRRTGRISG